MKVYQVVSKEAVADNQLDLRIESFVGMGQTSKAAGDMDSAARYFMSVALLFDHEVHVPAALYEAAAAYKSLGKMDAAQAARDDLIKRYPDSEWTTKAKGLLDG